MKPLKLHMEGFGAFREKTEVDFDSVELAALVGQTGSGKSTIIDGMTFALFGSVARYDDARAVAPVINQLEPEARVSLDFEVGGERYTAARVVRRTANGATTREARLEHGETVLAGQAREMGPRVEKLLGLDFDRFTKTVVLPQGRFAQFLHDKASDRQELLRHLLELGIYSRIGEEARRRASEARVRLDELEGQLAEAAPTQEQVAGLAATVEEATAVQAELARVMGELAAIGNELDAARLEVRRLDALLSAAGAATVPDAVREFTDRKESASEGLKEAEAEHSRTRNELDEARRLAGEGPNAETCRSLLADYTRLAQLDEELERLRTSEAEAERERDEAQRSDELLADELRAASDALEVVKAVKSVEALIAQLEAGEPCPVCRQPVADLPDHDIDTELEQALVAQAGILKDKKEGERRLREANDKAVEAKTRREANDEQRAGLAARLSDAPDEATLTADIDKAHKLAEARAIAESAETEALGRRTEAKASLDALESEEQAALAAFWRTRDELVSLRPPEPRGALLQDWEAFATWAAEKSIDLAEEKETAETSQRHAETRRGETADRARAVCAPYFEPGEDSDLYPVEMARSVERAKADHARAKAEFQARADLEVRIERLKMEGAVAADLGRLLRADGFERWLLEEVVASLVVRANERLLELSGGQYSFVADGTSFDIRDHHNADEVRGSKTLSGGETFLASLALALALSDSQAEMAPEGSPRLDSLFLDEGFGTLDPDALDVVAAAIEELGAEGRMVCVVTHIRDVADRMPVRFEVSKGPVTSSVKRVEA